MKTNSIIIVIAAIFLSINVFAQDTFSIVALDSITGEVGSAGASCVDMNNFPNYDTDFLGELFPAVGAINTQAWYHPTNQTNARNRMNLGDSPSEIIQWLVDNDVSSQPQLRQYGIVAFNDGVSESAAHTGSSTDDYKNHITGPNYSIQGNILLGQKVLDSMEVRFLREEGDLACKLMAALQGAKMIGADSRCFSNGTSSLFSFIKVAQPSDIFGNPSFLLSIETSDNAGIEPIDALQSLFDEEKICTTVGLNESFENSISIYPNPVKEKVLVKILSSEIYKIQLMDLNGKVIFNSDLLNQTEINLSHLSKGVYFIRISNNNNFSVKKIIKY